jgi:hypothetical protein
METMWKKDVVTLSKTFSCDAAQMISLVQDYLDNPHQFHSVKDLCTYWPRRVSIAGQQHDPDSFVDLVKRIEAFPATGCACERLFCQLRNFVGDFRRQMSDSMISDLLVIKTRIIWPNAAQTKKCAEILREVQSDTVPDQTATSHHLVPNQIKRIPNTETFGKGLSFKSLPVIPKRQL